MEIAAVLDRHSPVSEHELVDGIKSAISKLSLNCKYSVNAVLCA